MLSHTCHQTSRVEKQRQRNTSKWHGEPILPRQNSHGGQVEPTQAEQEHGTEEEYLAAECEVPINQAEENGAEAMTGMKPDAGIPDRRLTTDLWRDFLHPVHEGGIPREEALASEREDQMEGSKCEHHRGTGAYEKCGECRHGGFREVRLIDLVELSGSQTIAQGGWRNHFVRGANKEHVELSPSVVHMHHSRDRQ